MTTVVDGNSGGTALTTSTAVNQSTTAPTVQRLTSGSSATYTTPANVKWIRVRMIGGGGGGGGTNGSNANSSGSDGGDTSFGSWTAKRGKGYPNTGPGAPQSDTGVDGTGTLVIRTPGSGAGSLRGGSGVYGADAGASGPWGGAGYGGYNAAGGNAAANSGSGGGGAGGTPTAGLNPGGGGAGEYVEFIVNGPASTYTYTIGGGGNGGGGGISGGNGGTGVIIVEEHYNY